MKNSKPLTGIMKIKERKSVVHKMYSIPPSLKQSKCEHMFWKDRNPPNCFYCGKTEEELFHAKYKERIPSLKKQDWEKQLNENAT